MDELSLVTGGAGFIGSHLVEDLVRRGRPVRVLDDFSTGLRSNLVPGVEVVEGSLTDPAVVAKAMHRVGVVYHLAALASVAQCRDAAHHARRLRDWIAARAGRRSQGRRSTGRLRRKFERYGGSTGEAGQQESQLPAAKSPYAAAKLAGEFYMQAFAATYGIETVRLRFFNIFGPRQRADSPYSGVIALFTAAMARGEAPTVQGDGKQARDFTYVSNAVQALVKAAEAPEVSGNVYNVGTGRSVTVLELVAELNRVLGTDLEPSFSSPRTGDVRYSRADVRRTREDLGYDPATAFEVGLRRTVQWYLDSSGSFRRLQRV